MRDVFRKSGLDDVIGAEQFYLDINHAVEGLEHEDEEASHLADEADDMESDTDPI